MITRLYKEETKILYLFDMNAPSFKYPAYGAQIEFIDENLIKYIIDCQNMNKWRYYYNLFEKFDNKKVMFDFKITGKSEYSKYYYIGYIKNIRGI